MPRSLQTGLIIRFGLFLLAGSPAYAQQQPSLLQYMYNPFAINPAYAGFYDDPVFSLSGQTQMVGYHGAPTSAWFSVHGKGFDPRVGLGATVVSDKIGVTSTQGVYGSYAYKLISRNHNPLTNWQFKPTVLSFGLEAGFLYYQEDLTSLQADTDPNFGANVSSFTPDVGAGIYYHNESFYAGFSAKQLVAGTLGKPNRATQLKPHYYLSAGKTLDLNINSTAELSTLIKYIPGSPVQVDINTLFNLSEAVNVGVGYTSFSALHFMAGFVVNRSFRFGYGYTLPAGTESYQLGQAHEIMLNYRAVK